MTISPDDGSFEGVKQTLQTVTLSFLESMFLTGPQGLTLHSHSSVLGEVWGPGMEAKACLTVVA